MNLTFSVALDPSLSLYAVDKDGARISSVNFGSWFYPVQRGLPPGTIYTFRLLDRYGSVVVPANENFTALAAADEPKFQFGVQQYQGFSQGKYTLELVKLDIQNMHGAVVARANISVVRPYSASEENIGVISKNCSALLPPGNGAYASMDAPGARDLSDCIRDLAISQNDVEICKGISNYVNDSSIFGIDGCMGDYALNKSDLSLCAKRYRAIDRALCRAEVLDNYHECDAFECDIYWSCDQQREICLQNFAITDGNEALCRQVQDGDLRNRCLGMVLHDASYCSQITENESRSSCMGYTTDTH